MSLRERFATMPKEKRLYMLENFPLHLAESLQMDQLETILTTFDFLQAKLETVGIEALIRDYEYSQDEDLRLIQAALRLSVSALRNDPNQLASQLVGRLQSFANRAGVKRLLSNIQPAYRWFHPADGQLSTLRPPNDGLHQTIRSTGSIWTVIVSDDSLLYGGDDGIVYHYDLVSLEHQPAYAGHQGKINTLVATQSGGWFISGSDDRTVKIWQINKPSPIMSLEVPSPVLQVALDADERWLAGALADGQVWLWDNWQTVPRSHTFSAHNHAVNAVLFDPKQPYIYTASADMTISVWDKQTFERHISLPNHLGAIKSLAVTTDGKWLFSMADDRVINMWQISDFSHHRTIQVDSALWHEKIWMYAPPDHYIHIARLSLSADSRYLFTSANDLTIKMYDIDKDEITGVFEGHTDHPLSLAATKDNRWLISGSFDHERTVRIWDIAIIQARSASMGVRGLPSAGLCAANGLAVATSDGGMIQVWSTVSRSMLSEIEAHTRWIRGAALTDDGHYLATASDDRTVCIWELPTLRKIAVLNDAQAAMRAVSLTQEARIIVAGGDDGIIRLWNIPEQRMRELVGHKKPVRAVAISDETQQVFSGGYDGTIRVWDISGTQLKVIEGHSDAVRAIAVIPGRQQVVTVSADKTIKIWTFALDTVDVIPKAHDHWIRGVSVSSDGRYFATTGDDNMVKVWNTDTRVQIASFQVDIPIINCAIYSNDLHIVTTNNRGDVHFWEFV